MQRFATYIRMSGAYISKPSKRALYIVSCNPYVKCNIIPTNPLRVYLWIFLASNGPRFIE
jgi:hypothetical protein